VKETPTACSPFCRVYPSDRLSEATKYVNIHFLLRAAIPVNYTSEFRELFEATTELC
jgi:hypothetical protein